MNPREVFCPNPDCPARGRCGEGNIRIHARTPPRYRCTVCGTTFGARVGTVFHRCSTAEATITQVVTLVAHGCPVPAIVAAFGVQRQTVTAWVDGDWCASGAGSFPKKSTSWNWLWNSPNGYVSAQADWATASDCRSSGDIHSYLIKGSHNEQNASVNFGGITENNT